MIVRYSRPRWVLAGIVVLLLLAVLPFAALTLFAHPYFDDYNVANNTAALGRFASQWQWYQGWSGRVVTIFFDTMLDPLSWGQLAAPGSWVLPALRGLLLLAQLVQLVAAQQFFRALLLVLPGRAAGRPWRGLAWGLALLISALALNVMPEPFSFLYWYSAVFVYQLAWALSLGFGAGALRALAQPAAGRRWARLAGLCLVGAIGSGELAMLYCLVGLAGLGWWARAAQPAQRRLVGQWVVLAVLATGVVLTAPGNWQRHTLTDAYPQAHRWLLLLPRVGLALLHLVARPQVLGSLALLALVGLGVGRQPGRRAAAAPRRAHVLGLLVIYLLFNVIGAVFMKLLWVDPLLGRVQNMLLLALLTSTLVLALWVGTWWQPAVRREAGWWAAAPLAAGLLALGATGQVGQAWQELLWVAPSYNRQMLTRYALLRRAHTQRQAVAVLPPLRLPRVPGVLVPLPVPGRAIDFSVELKPAAAGNTEIARYYGLRAVRRQVLAAPQ